jgi:hypothetical protein
MTSQGLPIPSKLVKLDCNLMASPVNLHPLTSWVVRLLNVHWLRRRLIRPLCNSRGRFRCPGLRFLHGRFSLRNALSLAGIG